MAAETPQAPASSRERVEAALRRLGIVTKIREFPQGTRTCADAAAAIGCSVAQIAKSVVMRGRQSGLPVVVIASGANRVCEAKVSALVGEPLGRADAAFVRAATGFAIGGVAPVGHVGAVKLLVDEDLLALGEVWAAAGTPSTVFPVHASQLATLPGARVADVREHHA